MTKSEKIMCKDKYINRRYNGRMDDIKHFRKHYIKMLKSFNKLDK